MMLRAPWELPAMQRRMNREARMSTMLVKVDQRRLRSQSKWVPTDDLDASPEREVRSSPTSLRTEWAESVAVKTTARSLLWDAVATTSLSLDIWPTGRWTLPLAVAAVRASTSLVWTPRETFRSSPMARSSSSWSQRFDRNGPRYSRPSIVENDSETMRLTSSGKLDTNFGERGKVITNFSGTDWAEAVALQDDGNTSWWATEATTRRRPLLRQRKARYIVWKQWHDAR